jgi:hypothetical protein
VLEVMGRMALAIDSGAGPVGNRYSRTIEQPDGRKFELNSRLLLERWRELDKHYSNAAYHGSVPPKSSRAEASPSGNKLS